ncbi:nuclear fragile X mental retardation-interacting protein 1 [Scaptodrosophila lebanonensis]|uniref:Nuclear fragile X mental retardation-interacting protein 1 n=1 Tax=Drosophila lebanonensis TaxID=7225 RepID=A0A6J2TL41_DROLE|nr:nuclear fragile X mental retardation-interacting protein 1 [Scaptodrosophila lebanonensis]
MDGAAPNFLLPPPNFNQNIKDVGKTQPLYLTPCGMTLLPRSKQPPPMYGARGSTVPAKYLTEERQSNYVAPPILPPIYTAPPQPQSCINCNMQLATAQDMKRHLEQHEDCPADGCDFTALTSILEHHIETQHITGLYKTVKKAWTAEDIAAWRAERRKKYPTTANVEQAKRALEQRIKRGERLEASKARFGKREDRRRTQPQVHKDQPRPKKRQKKIASKRADKVKQGKPTLKSPPDVSPMSVPMFGGTSKMTDYKHSKSEVPAKVGALRILSMYGSDSEEEDEEESEVEDCAMESTSLKDSEKCFDTPATTASASEIDQEPTLLVAAVEDATNVEISKEPPENNKDKLEGINEQQPINEEFSSDEGPDEVPIERKTEEPLPVPTIQNSQAAQEKAQSSAKVADKRPVVQRKKRFYGLNYKRARQLRSQNTMLEKLLVSDIRHERNVLLQCVRYVCEQKFFGIGSKNIESKDGNISNTT